MPAGQESNWVVNGAIRLAHLYVSETQFALGCVRLLDREPRELQLREATFLDDPQQAKRFRQLITLDWDEPGERLLASSLAHEIVDHALLNQVGLRQGLRLKGGLAPSLRRQLVDYIEAHLDQPIAEAAQSITVAPADDLVAEAVGCEPGHPMLRVDRLYSDTTGTPLELSVSHFLPEQYTYRVTLRRSS